jgi:hypothetical protein
MCCDIFRDKGLYCLDVKGLLEISSSSLFICRAKAALFYPP